MFTLTHNIHNYFFKFSSVFLLITYLLIEYAHAESYKPLSEIFKSSNFSASEYSLVIGRCAALTSILKVEFDEVQASGNIWNQISEYFIGESFALPEVNQDPTEYIEFIKPYMVFYRAKMDQNYNNHGSLLLGIVKADMDSCLAFKDLIEQGEADNSSSQGNEFPESKMKEPEEYWSMINDSQISEKMRVAAINDLAKTCSAVFSSVLFGLYDEEAENLEPKNIPDPSKRKYVERYKQTMSNLRYPLSVFNNMGVAVIMAETNADKDVATQKFSNLTYEEFLIRGQQFKICGNSVCDAMKPAFQTCVSASKIFEAGFSKMNN